MSGAAATDFPERLDDTRRADPWDQQGPVPAAPDWLQRPAEQPTAAGASYPDYLDPGHGSGPDLLDNFPPPGRRRRNRLLVTTAVVIVALVAAAAVFLIRHPGGKAGRAPSPAAAGSPATGSAAGPAARSTGKASGSPASQAGPSTGQIFPHAQVAANGNRFSRVTAVLDQRCSAAARAAFAAALTSAGCQRVIRATFVDSGKQYAVTAGVAELPSPAAASGANRRMQFGHDIWFTGLDGPARSGATAVSKSVGVGYDAVYSRYIVYALATNSDGRNPTGHAAQIRTLKALAKTFTALTRQPLIAQGN